MAGVIHGNNLCDQVLARHPVLAFKAAGSEGASADVEEAFEAASVVTGEVVLAIEEVSVEEEASDIKVVEDLEDEVGMLMVLHHQMHQAVLVAGAVVLEAKPIALLHQTTVTVAVMVMVIEMAIGAVAPAEAQGMRAEIREAESVAVTENPLPLEKEDLVEIETETEKGIEIVKGMVAAAAADETMTTVRESGTTKVMGTMTQGAKDDTESPLYRVKCLLSAQKNHGLLVGIYVFLDFFDFLFLLLARG